MSTIINGEYARVAMWSNERELLSLAYQTPISEIEAEALVRHFVPNADVIFYPDIRSEAVDATGAKYIRLCSNPLSQDDIANGILYPRLQLGVVIHEIAHLLAGVINGHSQKFVSSLDFLCRETKEGSFKAIACNFLEESNKKKKISKSISKIISSSCPVCQKTPEIVSSFDDVNYVYHQLKCGHLMQVKKDSFAISKESFTSVKGEALYNFQRENVEKFKESNGHLCILDEMGLGKTPSSLAISHLYKLHPTLIICKAKLKYQWFAMVNYWGQKYDEFGIPEFNVQVINSSKDTLLAGMHYYIISYDTLPLMPENFFQKTINGKERPLNLQLAIIDECQHMKNADTQRTRAVFETCKSIPNIVFTSGTPIKNNAVEFYPMLHMCSPVMFPNKAVFARDWVDTYMSGQYIKYGGIRSFEKFSKATSKFIIRHTQAEVMPDLPEITRNFLYTELDSDTENDYSKLAKEFAEFYYNTSKEDRQFFQGILAYFTRMRHMTGLAKVDEAYEFASDFLESTERKLAIFTHHIDVRKMLVEKLNKWLHENALPSCLELVGNMDGNSIEELKQKFNFNPSYRILVASTLASGEGHNLQHACSDCLFIERQWNPANEEQAEFRFKRMGQKASVITATYLVAVETIDEMFTSLVEKKRMIVKNSLDGTGLKFNENEILTELAQMIATRQNKKLIRK